MIQTYVENMDNYVEYIVKSNLRDQDRKSVYNDRRAIIDRFLDVLDSGLIAIPSRDFIYKPRLLLAQEKKN